MYKAEIDFACRMQCNPRSRCRRLSYQIVVSYYCYHSTFSLLIRAGPCLITWLSAAVRTPCVRSAYVSTSTFLSFLPLFFLGQSKRQSSSCCPFQNLSPVFLGDKKKEYPGEQDMLQARHLHYFLRSFFPLIKS